MESRVFKILMLVLFLLLNGCGDRPMEPKLDNSPGAEDNSDLPTDLNYTPHELLPMQSGASWEYSVKDKQYSWGAELEYQATKYGKAVFKVIEVKGEQRAYSFNLSVNFVIDSCHVKHQMSYTQDTTYTQFNLIDTSYVATLVERDEELRRKNAIFLQHFLPAAPEEDSHVYLGFFNFGYLTVFGYDLSFRSQSESGYVFYAERNLSLGLHKIKAIFDTDNGGPIKLTSAASQGWNSGSGYDTVIELSSFTPGGDSLK